MTKQEWSTPQKSRIMSIVHTKVELGQSVRGLWKEKQQSGALERGEWPSRSTYRRWMKEVEQHGIDAGSRRHRKQSTKIGRPSLKSADQSNDMAKWTRGSMLTTLIVAFVNNRATSACLLSGDLTSSPPHPSVPSSFQHHIHFDHCQRNDIRPG
jgi:hypothetical protein